MNFNRKGFDTPHPATVIRQQMLHLVCVHIWILLVIGIIPKLLRGQQLTGARLTKAYDVTIQIYRNSHTKTENSRMHILRCMGSKFLCEISKVPFEILHKILNPYTAKIAFHEVLKIRRLMRSQSYDILSLSETGPSCPCGWWDCLTAR